jgi:hypothetical protein
MSVLEFGGLDFRPRVVFWTEAGAVVVLVDPTTAVSGQAIFPVIGAVPYALDVDPLTGGFNVRLDLPTGPYLLPISLGGGEGGSLVLPGLGPATYEVVIGPPQIPEDQLASGWSLMTAGLTSLWPILLLGVGAVLLMMRRK